jgi:hypothetical protein
MSEPLFPVLCLSHDNSISVAENLEALGRANALAFFRNRYFNGLIIIDSRAQRFRVVRAEVAPPLSTLARAVVRVLNRRVRVKLHLEAESSMSLDDAKRLVKVWLDRARIFGRLVARSTSGGVQSIRHPLRGA